jgi:hypothetical protein
MFAALKTLRIAFGLQTVHGLKSTPSIVFPNDCDWEFLSLLGLENVVLTKARFHDLLQRYSNSLTSLKLTNIFINQLRELLGTIWLHELLQ